MSLGVPEVLILLVLGVALIFGVIFATVKPANRK